MMVIKLEIKMKGIYRVRDRSVGSEGAKVGELTKET